jgi:hypothetical protein
MKDELIQNAGQTLPAPTWLAFVICFALSLIFIGLPLGCWLGSRLAIRDARREFGYQPRHPCIDHVAELPKHSAPLIVYLSAKLCVGYRLLFLKLKLLLQKAFLKTVRQTAGDPCADQCAKSNRASASKEGLECHRNVVTRANAPAHRRRANDV